MTPTQEASEYITIKLAEAGVYPTDKIRDEVYARLKEGLCRLEHEVFRAVLNENGMGPPDPKTMSARDIVVYPSGAFNIVMAAPGGAVEVGEDGKPLPHEVETWNRRMAGP